MACTGVIPNTCIACGEEGQYCSKECWEAAGKPCHICGETSDPHGCMRLLKQPVPTPDTREAAIQKWKDGHGGKGPDGK